MISKAELQQESLHHLVAVRRTSDDLAVARAEQAVVTSHLSVADSVARQFWGRGVPLEDLEQVARLALIRATKRWEPDKGAQFVGFAVPTIIGSVKHYFRDHLRLIRVPRRLQEINAASRQAEQDLWQVGITPRSREVAAVLRVARREVDQALLARTAVATLDGATQLPVDPDPDHTEEHLDLVTALRSLTPHERELLNLYYFQDHTQQMIAERFGQSQMQISRQLASIHQRLRRQMLAVYG